MDKTLQAIKRTRHIKLLVVAGLGLLLLAVVLLLQVPRVQTAVVRKAIDSYNAKGEGRISVGSVNLLPFKTLVLKDVTLIDKHPAASDLFERRDTVLHLGSVIATFNRKGLTQKPLRIKRLTIENARCAMVKDSPASNITRVLDIKGGGGIKDIGDFLHLETLNIRNLRFTVDNAREQQAADTSGKQGVDFNSLDLFIPLVKAHGLAYKDGHIVFDVDECSFSDRSGYQVSKLSAHADIADKSYSVEDLTLLDNWSSLTVPFLGVEFDTKPMTSNFEGNDHFNISIKNSRLDAQSVSFLLGDAGRWAPVVTIAEAQLHGTAADMQIDRLRLSEQSGVQLSMEGHLKDITEPSVASADIRLGSLTGTTSAIQSLLRKCGIRADLSRYAPGRNLCLQGHGKGPLNALNIDASLNGTGIGSVICNLRVGGLTRRKAPVKLGGRIETDDLDLGAILGAEAIRQCSLQAYLEASMDGRQPQVRLDSLFVDRLNLLGYDYSNLAAAGTFSGSAFDGRVICSDPNLNFIFQGLFNLSGKTSNALYKFYLNLGYADLHALGIDQRDISRATGTLNANYVRIRSGEILGDIGLTRVELESPDGKYDLGPVLLSSSFADNTHRISLKSDFIKGSFVSDSNPLEAVDIIKGASVERFLPALLKSVDSGKTGLLDLDLLFTDTHNLLSFFKSGSYIADGSTLKLHVGPDKDISTSVKAQRIAIKDKYVKDLDLDLHSTSTHLLMTLASSEVKLGAPFKLLSGVLSATAADDHLESRLQWDNDSTSLGRIFLSTDIARGSDDGVTLAASTLPGEIVTEGQRWIIDGSDLFFNGRDLLIDGLRLHNGSQSITADGRLLRDESDSLAITIDKVDMGMFSALAGMHLGGEISGKAFVTSPYKERLGIRADLHSAGTTLSGADAGDLQVSGQWDLSQGLLTFDAGSTVGGKTVLDGGGVMQTRDGSIDASMGFNAFNLACLSDFIPEVSIHGGELSGELAVNGTMDKLVLKGSGTRVDGASLTVNRTGVTYNLDGAFEVSDDAVNLDGISFSDGARGHGRFSGGLRHNHLKDFRLALNMDFSDMLVFDINDQAENLYGKLALHGNARLSGPPNDLSIKGNARNAGASSLHMLLKSGTVSSTDLLTFKQPEVWEDPYERMLREMHTGRAKTSNTDISLHLEPDPELEINLDIDRSSGNAVSARGSGTIDVSLNPRKGDPVVTGDYNISSGNVHFSALGITTRDFTVKEGSNLKFNGAIMDSDLDIDASYTTKVSLANLISDTTSVSTRRTVECGINISDKLRNPQLRFDINIPDLDPTVEGSVRSALNTEDKVQRQFLSLLVTNNFLPSDQGGIVNNSDMLYSNVSEIMAGQLNNILQRLDIPLDLGLKYQPGEDGTDLFDVAVSTQLFNNRVTVNGNIGNRQDGVTQTGSDVAGDLDIGIKLDKSGAVQMNLFSHSADIYSNYLDNLQRNGIGIGYQREFSTFRQLWYDLTNSRRKRTAKEPALPGSEEQKVTIKIDGQNEQ